jgi:site-specific DNA-cytosine methylase
VTSAAGRPPECAAGRAFAMLADVKKGRNQVSADAEASYLADVALASKFDELLARAEAAERDFRRSQAAAAPAQAQYPLAKTLDEALTDVTHAAYAARRAEIGPHGYDDRIVRRKAMATPAVHRWTDEAERLLTLRETHRLTGFPARPEAAALGAEIARAPRSTAH